MGPILLCGPIFWPLADAPEVLRVLRDFGPQAPEELGMVLFARLAPPGPLVPPEHYGKPVLGLTLTWVGDPAAGLRAIAPLRRAGTPIADHVRPLPYLFLQSMVDGGNQHGMHWYWRSQRVPALTDEVIDVVCGLTDTITSPLSYVAGFVTGGTAGQVDPEATAVGERGNGFELSIVAGWPPPDPGGDRLKRLTALKDSYDPANLFRLNANIPPTALVTAEGQDRVR